MAPCLHDCPVELVESIACHLSLHDHCNLRLTNRGVAAKSSQGIFKSYFLKKTVEMTRPSLQMFAYMTSGSESMVCLLEDLTLVGNVYDTTSLEDTRTERLMNDPGEIGYSNDWIYTEKELARIEKDLGVLRERQMEDEALKQSQHGEQVLGNAFRNLAQHSKQGRLRKITLKVMVCCGVEGKRDPYYAVNWWPVWSTAAYTFRTTVNSLARSRLRVERLSILNELGQWRCSLACNVFKALGLNDSGSLDITSGLKSLSVSLSDPLPNETGFEPHVEDVNHEAIALGILGSRLQATESDGSHIVNTFKSMTALEQLDLHWFKLAHHEQLRPHEAQGAWLTPHLSVAENFPLLRECSISGLRFSEASLMALVKHPTLMSLSLLNVSMMEGGTFRAVFDFCTSESTRMRHLYFDDLWERQLLHFDEPGHPKFPSRPPTRGPSTLTREGTNVRRRIDYHFSRGRSLGSPEAARWHRQRVREHGPP